MTVHSARAGDVCGIEFDSSDWTVTHICVNLSDKAIIELGYEKPRFLHISGRVLVDVPVNLIKDVSDVVILKKEVTDLKNIIEEHLKSDT